jgi:hypothetical protein
MLEMKMQINWQRKNSDQSDQTCNHRILRNTQPILFKLGSNLADETP